MVLCTELRADTRIRNAATKKLDSRILAIVSMDIVAAKAHHIRSCYRLYTINKNSQQEGDVGANDNDGEHVREAAVSQSYSELFDYLRTECFSTPKVMMMTDVNPESWHP